MKEMLNITTIRRVLKYLSILLLIVWKPSFLTASGKDVVVIDFKGKKITQEGLLEGLRQYKERYIEKCKKLAEKFKQINEDENLKFGDNFKGRLMRDCVIPFHKFIVAGNWDMWDLDLFRDKIRGSEAHKERCVHMVKFFLALKNLGHFKSDDLEIKEVEDILFSEATKFVKEKIPTQFQSYNENIQEKKGKSEELQMTFVLENGTVSEETSCKLFEDFTKPFRLAFQKVRGEFCAGKQLKNLVVLLTFQDSDLEFTEGAFENASRLKKLEVAENEDEGTVLVFGKRSFANCQQLKFPFGITLDGERPGNLVSAFENCPYIRKERIQKVALDFFEENVGDGSWKDVEQIKKYFEDNQLDKAYMWEYYDLKLKEERNKRETLRKNYEKLQEKQKALEKENERLKNDGEDFRKKMLRPLEQKNQRLKESLKKTEEEYQKTSQELLQVTGKYEKLKKQYAETVAKHNQESGKLAKDCERERLEKVKARDENKALQEEVKTLKKDKETQEEKIRDLEDFKEKWGDKIDMVPTLEAKNEQLEKQLNKETKDRMTAEERLDLKYEQCDEYEVRLKEKNKIINRLNNTVNGLKKDLENTLLESTKLRARIKELETSEAYGIRQGEEEPKKKVKEPKKEVKNDDFRQKKEPFYPKRKGKKGKFVPYNPEG